MMSLLRIVLLFVFLTGSASAQAPARASAEPVPADRIVAVVNDEVITLYELRSRLEGAVSQLRQQVAEGLAARQGGAEGHPRVQHEAHCQPDHEHREPGQLRVPPDHQHAVDRIGDDGIETADQHEAQPLLQHQPPAPARARNSA